MLSWLTSAAATGHSHLDIANGLMTSGDEIVAVSPTFFALTIDAHLQAAQIYAAKLYDRRSDAVTVQVLIEGAESSAGEFPYATAEQVRSIAGLARLQIRQMRPHQDAIKIRRDGYLVHFDRGTVRDVQALNENARLTIDDLDYVLVETVNILNSFSQGRNGTVAFGALTNALDYGDLLDQCRKSISR